MVSDIGKDPTDIYVRANLELIEILCHHAMLIYLYQYHYL